MIQAADTDGDGRIDFEGGQRGRVSQVPLSPPSPRQSRVAPRCQALTRPPKLTAICDGHPPTPTPSAASCWSKPLRPQPPNHRQGNSLRDAGCEGPTGLALGKVTRAASGRGSGGGYGGWGWGGVTSEVDAGGRWAGEGCGLGNGCGWGLPWEKRHSWGGRPSRRLGSPPSHPAAGRGPGGQAAKWPWEGGAQPRAQAPCQLWAPLTPKPPRPQTLTCG